ncbi:hypothetical protein KSS87_000152 [Heliosperma pusillum]|nr:hypothetical protein KSS87_000152 [Heliosperma pusillum]
MEHLCAILKHPDELYPLLKLKLAVNQAQNQIPEEVHWCFCYSMLNKVSRSFAFVIQSLGTELRNAVCVFYLVLRALDTIEDDMSIATEVKIPILKAFHQHIYDRDWHFSCDYQEAIRDITKRMGAGMAQFICKEKTNIIQDYLEDISEIPKSRMFWPREIWIKYVNKLEDLKYEENSEEAVQCLNVMVTNALLHVEDCLTYLSALRDHAIFRFCAIPQIMAIGTLALCYNNVQIFKGVVKMRRGKLHSSLSTY